MKQMGFRRAGKLASQKMKDSPMALYSATRLWMDSQKADSLANQKMMVSQKAGCSVQNLTMGFQMAASSVTR